MRTVLVFPPGWAPHSPYLALPILAAHLRAAGHRVDVWDANVDLLHHVLSAPYLRNMAQRLENALSRSNGPKDDLSRALLLLADGLAAQIESAKEGFSSFRTFQDATSYEKCRRIIGTSLKLVSAAQGGVSLDLYRLTFPGAAIRSSSAALDLAGNGRTEIFREYYAERLAAMIDGAGLVGFSVTERDQLVPALVFAREVRRRHGTAVKVVFGGNYFTRIARSWNGNHPFQEVIDYVVLGEGERGLVGLVEALRGERALEQVDNLLYWDGRDARKNEGVAVAIDEAPFADFSGMPLDRYLSPALILPTYATRSCAWNRCNFCTIAGTSGAFRMRSATRIADEIEYQKGRHATAFFTFIDETLPPGIIRNVAREVNARKLDVRWYGEARIVKSFSDDVLGDAHRAGLRLIQFGLESYNQRVLDRIGKGIKEADVLPVLRRSLAHGIAFHLFCMVGFPGETEQEARQTLRFADDVIRVGRDEFQNPCCTKGIGTFGLEKNAPIWHKPEAFGVTLEPPPAECDLVLDSAYHVSEGLSADEAAALLDDYAGSDLYREIGMRRDVSFVNRRLSPSPPREEETFIRWACDGRDDLPGLRLHCPKSFGSTHITLRTDVGSPAAVDIEQCVVYTLDARRHDLLQRLSNGSAAAVYAAAATNRELARDVARFDRLGLVDAPPAFSLHECTPEELLSAWIAPFEEIDFLYLPGDEYCLFDPQREAAIRLNHSGALLWEMSRGGNRGKSLLDRAQALFGPAMTPDRFAGFINHLSRNGALFVQMEAPG